MRKQNMAGRIALAIATVLLCAVFVTTSVLSTTFAKYTTTGELDSETARVAKWGIELSHSPIDATKWSVVENGTSITAASSGTTGDNVIAPGTSGYLACFRVEGNPEVAHNVTMDFNVTIDAGYKNLIGQDDYFPILISVGRASYNNGSNEAIDRNERHYYVPKTGLGTLDKLISAVNSEPFTEPIAPNGWSGIAYAEYYVRWDWFYNAYDVPNYIPDVVKTALSAYQNSGDDTLLSAAMVHSLDAAVFDATAANKTNIQTLETRLSEARTALSGNQATMQSASNNLDAALAAVLGEDAKTYSFSDAKTVDIRWDSMFNSGLMTNNVGKIESGGGKFSTYQKYYTVTATESLISSDPIASAHPSGYDMEAFLFYDTGLDVTANTEYYYYFKARNHRAKGYGGVLAGWINSKALTLYGAFQNSSDLGAYMDLDVTHGYPVTGTKLYDNGQKLNVATTTVDGNTYGQYRIYYNGLEIAFQYMESGTTTYKTLYTYTAPSGGNLSLGVFSRHGTGTSGRRTIEIRDAYLDIVTPSTSTTAASYKSALSGLISKAESVLRVYKEGNSRDFTISANATIAITQTKSELNP